MMPGNDELGTRAQLSAAVRDNFRGFDFDIDGARPAVNGEAENAELIFNAAVELAVILMAAAGGEDSAVGIALQEIRNGVGAGNGIGQVIETELEKVFAGFRFAAGLFEQAGDIGKTKRNTNPGEGPTLGHIWLNRISKALRRAAENLMGKNIERSMDFESEPSVRVAE